MIAISCPTCSAPLRVHNQLAGQKLACPKCQQRLLIPEPPRINRTILAPLREDSPLPVATPVDLPANRISTYEALIEQETTSPEPKQTWVRWLSPSFLTTSIILFFLPFTYTSCQNKTIATQNAYQTAYGGLSLEIVVPENTERRYPQPALFMIFAILFTFLALLPLWLIRIGPSRQILGLTLVGLTLALLLAQLIAGWPLVTQIREQIQKQAQEERDPDAREPWNRPQTARAGLAIAQTVVQYGTASGAYLWLVVLIGTITLIAIEPKLNRLLSSLTDR